MEEGVEACKGPGANENTFGEFVGVESFGFCWVYVRDAVSFLSFLLVECFVCVMLMGRARPVSRAVL